LQETERRIWVGETKERDGLKPERRMVMVMYFLESRRTRRRAARQRGFVGRSHVEMTMASGAMRT
jgi:hypothetical protein